jgi:hypothetical protein
LPPWTYDETLEVARTIHGFDASGDSEILTRYKRYGGIPRFVMQYAQSKITSDPLQTALSRSNVILALTEAGTGAFDHSEVAGTIMHLIRDESLLKSTYVSVICDASSPPPRNCVEGHANPVDRLIRLGV